MDISKQCVDDLFSCACVRRYKDRQHEREELVKRRMEYIESGNKLWKEERARRQEQVDQDHWREMERREREKALVTEYAELRMDTRAENARKFRELLDKQCVSRI